MSLEKNLVGIKRLPQWEHCGQDRAEWWIQDCINHDASRIDWHIRRLQGFGGSDMSVLWGAANGVFHPFGDPRKVTAQKLLQFPFQSPTGDQRRGIAMEEQARKWLTEKWGLGAIRREDLLEKINTSTHPTCAWWQGSVDDIWEVNGKLILVDYKVPSLDSFKEFKKEIPWYYDIQLHHYWGLAKSIGLEIDELKIVAFNCDQWDGWIGDVDKKDATLAGIEEIGEWFWNEYVLQGKVAPGFLLKGCKGLNDWVFSEDVRKDKFLQIDVQAVKEGLEKWSNTAWGSAMIVQEAEKSRESASFQLQQTLPLRALSFDIQKIEVGGVRLRPDWRYSQHAVLETIKNGLTRLGKNEAAIQQVLIQENFWKPVDFDVGSVEDILKKEYNIDIRKDPKFFDARKSDPDLNMESITQYLRTLEKVLPHGVDWEVLVDWSASQLKVEMQRTPMAGPLKDLRVEMGDALRPDLMASAEKQGSQFALFRELEREEKEKANDKPKVKRKNK